MAFTPDAGTNETAQATQANTQQNDPGETIDDWGNTGLACDPNDVDEFAGVLTGKELKQFQGERGPYRRLKLDFTSVQVFAVQGEDPYTDDEFSLYANYNVGKEDRGPSKNSAFGRFLRSAATVLNVEPVLGAVQDALQEEEYSNFLHFKRHRDVEFGGGFTARSVWEMIDKAENVDDLRPMAGRTASNPRPFSNPDDDRRHLNWGDHTVVGAFDTIWGKTQEAAGLEGKKPTAVMLRKVVAEVLPEDEDANFWASKGKGNPDSLWQQMARAGIITE